MRFDFNVVAAHPLFNGANAELLRRFLVWEAANPHVFSSFTKYAAEMKQAGRLRYSAWVILQRIRWDWDVSTAGDVFEINNDFIGLYARLLMAVDPVGFTGFFELRRMKTIGRRMKRAREAVAT